MSTLAGQPSYMIGRAFAVRSALIITTSLPAGTVAAPYNQTIQAVGGAGGHTFVVLGGESMPTGLTLSTAGVLAGTPSVASTFAFSVTATDLKGSTNTRAYNLTVNPAVAITTTTLPTWTAGLAFSQTVNTTGGTSPLAFTNSAGLLPTGLTLATATGIVSGTPNLNVDVIDDTFHGTNNTPINQHQPDVYHGAPFQGFTTPWIEHANNDDNHPPFIFNNTLMCQVGLNNTGAATNVLTRSVNATMTFAFGGSASDLSVRCLDGDSSSTAQVVVSLDAVAGTFRIFDSVTSQGVSTSVTPNLNASHIINVQTVSPDNLHATVTATLDGITTLTYNAVRSARNATFNTLFGVEFGVWNTATGREAVSRFTVLPLDKFLFAFTVTATDANASVASQNYSVLINAAITFTTTSLPAGTINTAYSQTLAWYGGTGSVTLAVTTGSLPTGLTMTSLGVISGTPTAAGALNFTVTGTDSLGAMTALPLVLTINSVAHGNLSGTPTTAGTYNFTITATDSHSPTQTGSQSYTVVIAATLAVTTTTLPGGTQNVAYNQTVNTSGGTPSITFALTAGTLPTGVTLSTAGVLLGTPSSANTFAFTITATDSLGQSASQSYTVTIAPSSTPTLITASRFTFQGTYTTNGTSFANGNLNGGRGLTHRFVGSATVANLRFMSLGYGGPPAGNDPLYEWKITDDSNNQLAFGSALTGNSPGTGSQLTNSWAEIFSPAHSGPNYGFGDESGIFWDSTKNGLFTSQATDYPGDGTPGSDSGTYTTHCICFRQLNSNGTISGFVGPYGFANIGQRAISSGYRATPSRWQSAYGLKPYLAGWGGYTSRVAIGLTGSNGLIIVSAPDVTTYSNPTAAIPSTDYAIGADHRGGWTDTTKRGQRDTSTTKDYYDDPTYNSLPNPPQFPHGSITGATNASPIGITTSANHGLNTGCPVTITGVVGNTAADVTDNLITVTGANTFTLNGTSGNGAYVSGGSWAYGDPTASFPNLWLGEGDTFDGTGVCIDTGTDYAFVAIGTFSTGKAYYAGSELNADSLAAILQVFDPADFQKVINGIINAYAVQPTSTKSLNSDMAAYSSIFTTAYPGSPALVVGATWIPELSQLWVLFKRSDFAGNVLWLSCWKLV